MINFTVKKIIIVENYIITKILTYYFYQTILEYSNTWLMLSVFEKFEIFIARKLKKIRIF